MLLPRAARRRPRGARRGRAARGRRATRASSRAAPSAAPTTCTGRCGTSTSTRCSARSQAAAGPGGAPGSLAERLARDDASGRIEQLKRAVEAEIRRRLVEDRGAAGARALGAPARCPRTSTSCTRPATSWPRMHRALVPAQPQARGAPRAQAPQGPPRRARPAPHGARLDVDRRGADHPALQAAAPRQARDLRHRRRLGVRRQLRALHAAAWSTRSRRSSARSAASCSSTASTRRRGSSRRPRTPPRP